MSRKGFGILLVLFLVLLIYGGMYVYTSPTRVVKDYISNYQIDKMLYSESISNFLSYSTDRDLPSPSIDLITNKHSMTETEILVSFGIITYGADNNPINVHSGNLLFSLVRKKWKWEIDSIKIINNMKMQESLS